MSRFELAVLVALGALNALAGCTVGRAQAPIDASATIDDPLAFSDSGPPRSDRDAVSPADVVRDLDPDLAPDLGSGADSAVADATSQVCPNGIREGTEQCDRGQLNSWLPDAPCRPDCTSTRCGDGVIDRDEACDDGSATGGGNCNACALAQVAALEASPPALHFGAFGQNCDPPRTIGLELLNPTKGTVEVTEVIAVGCSAEVELPASGVSASVPPGARLAFGVTFNPQQPGSKSCALRVIAAAGELRLPLTAAVSPAGTQVDRFLQRSDRMVDILFAVDPSASMIDERDRLIATASTFATSVTAAQLDFQLGAVSIAPPMGETEITGELIGDPPYIDNQTSDIKGQFEVRLSQTAGTAHEYGIDAVIAALSPPLTATLDHTSCVSCMPPKRCVDGGCRGRNWGFRRPAASLEILVLTDEDDQSTRSVAEAAAFFREQINPLAGQFVRIHALLPEERCATLFGASFPRWEELIRLTGGSRHDSCSDDYAPVAVAITDRLFGLQDRFPLSRPAQSNTITVTVDQRSASFVHDADSGTVVLDPPPADGAVVEVQYTPTCP